MSRIDGLSAPGVAHPPQRIAFGHDSPAGAVRSVPRDQILARELDERLSSRLDHIRAGITDAAAISDHGPAPNPPGAGQRLDILA